MYRFRARLAGSDFHTVVDYGPNASFDWTTISREGTYEIEVSVKSGDGTQTAKTSAMVAMTSLATDAPAITATSNALVFIYSAPPCPLGDSMSVQFTSPDGITQSTPPSTCGGYSMNFYLAGMQPRTSYSVQHTLVSGSAAASGPILTLTTGASPVQAPPVSLLSQDVSPVDGILLQSFFFIAGDCNRFEGQYRLVLRGEYFLSHAPAGRRGFYGTV
jgi:hypothetical protein